MEVGHLLELKNLKTYFYTEDGEIRAVDGVDLTLDQGDTLGIVGESGCGKSVTAFSIMRLIPSPPGKIVGGELLFNKSIDLAKLSQGEMRSIRGNQISMIFQEPMASLNPVYTVGEQISETISLHRKLAKRSALLESVEILRRVGIPAPERRIDEYPHQLSGGMCQRVMIAMALSCNPQLLIADEPTTALDVTIQAQILELLFDLKDRLNMTTIMITHDLGVIAEIADQVAVMYAGKVVEYTDVETLFIAPRHPYTWGLMNSMPKLEQEVERLTIIPGIVPSPLAFPSGCKYHNRCPIADQTCKGNEPEMTEIGEGHLIRCWHPEKLADITGNAGVAS